MQQQQPEPSADEGEPPHVQSTVGVEAEALRLLESGSAQGRTEAYALVHQLIRAHDLEVQTSGKTLESETAKSIAEPLPRLVSALWQHVLCAEASEITIEEWCSVQQLVADATARDTFLIGTAAGEHFGRAYFLPHTYQGRVLAKKASELTDADALITSWCDVVLMQVCTYGVAQCCVEGQLTRARAPADAEMDFLSRMMSGCGYFPQAEDQRGHTAASSDERNWRLCELLIQRIRNAEELGLTEANMAGCFGAFFMLCSARPAVGRFVVETLQAVPFFMEHVRRFQVSDCVLREKLIPGSVWVAIRDSCLAAQGSGLNIARAIIEFGVVDRMVDIAVELERSNAGKKANVMCCWWAIFFFLAEIDLTQPTAEPIVAKFLQIPSAVRYALDHPLVQFESAGCSTLVQGTMLAAELWGKTEADKFQFRQYEINFVVSHCQELIDPQGGVGEVTTLSPSTGHAMRCLIVADKNKELLLAVDGFIPHLVAGLMLDSDKYVAVEPSLRGVIQARYAECLEQVALFTPGKDALVRENSRSGVEAAVRKVMAAGLTKDAKVSAHGALMALGLLKSQSSAAKPGASTVLQQHLMMSYNWEHQDVILRIATELKSRAYVVWIDVESMSGSTVDSMAEAVEGSELMLIGFSSHYKESANVRNLHLRVVGSSI